MSEPTNPIEIPTDHVLADDPDLATLWALFQAAWDKAEYSIMSLFQVITGLDPFVQVGQASSSSMGDIAGDPHRP